MSDTVLKMELKEDLLYLKIAGYFEHQIKSGSLKTGDKIPSVRTISKSRNVSPGTVVKAYFELEKKLLIQSKPKSGYFVCYVQRAGRSMSPGQSSPASSKGSVAEIFYTVFNNRATEMNLSSSQIASELIPVARLNKELISAVRRLPNGGAAYSPNGNPKLKQQVAARWLLWGGSLKAEDIIPTSGSMDALSLVLSALLKRGDTIAVESPLNFGIINLAQTLGYRLLELPTDPVNGMEIPALKKALEKQKVHLCLLMGNYSNPFSSCMPAENQKEVVRLLEQYNIPLVEDDVFGDLYFGQKRHSFCKTFDDSGNVLWCGSASKILAGGYRVGWLAPGKFKEQILRSRPYHCQTCNTLTHEAMGAFMENNGYENYLKKLRQALYVNSLKFRQAIDRHFPKDTKITTPDGGIHLWLELGSNKEAIDLYNKSLIYKIGITPGRMYTMQHQFNNCFTLNYSMPMDAKVEKALALLGRFCQ